jgi:mono/diheme cytochrome c family protein
LDKLVKDMGNLGEQSDRVPRCKRAEDLGTLIVFHREGTLDLTYRHITAKREKDPIFDLKVILLCTALAAVLGSSRAQEKTDQRHPARQPNTLSGKETFLKYCASCHGEDAKGNGPAAEAATFGSNDSR